MGRQYNFAMDETDENLFMAYLKEKGYDIYWCNKEGVTKVIEQLPKPFSDKWLNVYIYHTDFGDMKSSFSRHKTLEPITAPVIEFGRTVVWHDDKKIHAGRIWMQMKYWSESGDFVSKSENLDKAFKDIKKWIMKHLQSMEQRNERGKVKKIAVSRELLRLFEEEGYHW